MNFLPNLFFVPNFAPNDFLFLNFHNISPSSSTNGPRKRLVLVIGGDDYDGAKDIIYKFIQMNWPIVVLKNTGDLEDVVTEVVSEISTSEKSEKSENPSDNKCSTPNVYSITGESHPTELACLLQIVLSADIKKR